MAFYTYLTITGGDMRATPTRDRVYQFVKGYISQYKYPPSVPEIAAAVGIKPGSVQYQLEKLHADGSITLGPHSYQIDISFDGKECLRCERPW